MGVNSSRLGAASYSTEADFGDRSVTTFGTRVPIVGTVDVTGLQWPKEDIGRTVQYANDGTFPVRMPRSGSFTIRMPLTGHGSTAAGALSATSVATLLGIVAGNAEASAEGGTIGGTPTTTTLTHSASDAFLAGQLCRIGAIADARGGGQAYPVVSQSGTAVTLGVATPAAPDAGDTIYAMQLVYPNESPNLTSCTSTRWNLQTANQRYSCWGCYPTSIRFTGLNPGELPYVEIEFSVSDWDTESASTWPNESSVETFTPVPVAAGSFFINTLGTSTRQVRDVRSFELTINLEVIPLTGPGADDAYVITTGARRIRCAAEFSLVLDAEDAGTDSLGDEWKAEETYQHALYTLSAADGKALAFYFPRIVQMGSRPVQRDVDGLNRIEAAYRAFTNSTGATERIRSNWRLGIG
jgi:hypothetical protein